MNAQPDFVQFEQDRSSWWYLARRKLLREVAEQAVRAKPEARILDMGGAAELTFEPPALFRVVNRHSTLAACAFHQMHGGTNLVCSGIDELPFGSNCFDLIVAGDFLQSAPDDRVALRELRRVLKDGGLLCLT